MPQDTIELDELGEDVTQEFERPKGKAGIVISVRLEPAAAEQLLQVAEREGRTISYVAREAIRSYLAMATSPAATITYTTIQVTNGQVMNATPYYSFGGIGSNLPRQSWSLAASA